MDPESGILMEAKEKYMLLQKKALYNKLRASELADETRSCDLIFGACCL